MTRRDFVKGSAAAATFVASGAGYVSDPNSSVCVDGHVLPSWVMEQITMGVDRYKAWKGTDETVAFPYMTDCHSWFWGFSRINLRTRAGQQKAVEENLNLDFGEGENWDDPKMHILMMRKLAHLADADFIADLGDHDFDFVVFAEPIPLWQARGAMRAYRKLYERETLPTLFARGNHDHSSRRISDTEYGETFNRTLNAGKKMSWHLSEDGTYGYLDISNKKFRAVFLNSSRGYYNGLDGAQLQFLSDAFASAPTGWHVVEMQHIPVFQMQNWRRGIRVNDISMRIAYQIMDSYANRRGDFVQGWQSNAPKNVWKINGKGNVSWLFKDTQSHFAGAFFGHEHVEDFIHYGKVPLVTRPGLGTIPSDCIAGEMKSVKGGGYLPPKTILLDLVAIKPSKRMVHVFRCGLGGADSDLEYTY